MAGYLAGNFSKSAYNHVDLASTVLSTALTIFNAADSLTDHAVWPQVCFKCQQLAQDSSDPVSGRNFQLQPYSTSEPWPD